MDMRIYVNHWCLNVTLCRWPPCLSLHPCSRCHVM